MYSKISARNVKRSFKDYTIYFLTLTFAVCIFYAFNSISSQNAMIEVSKSKIDIMKMLSGVISMTSVLVSIILGFLIVYANNFLIKRRKKEIGLYMTLGMSKRKISSLLIKETFLIGLISLAVGLIAGVGVSQGLSLFTSRLFEVNVSKYNFIFSPEAAVKTAIYFGLIFVLVMLFNTFTISKYKLIDLLRAGRKNESIKIKNIKVSFGLFLVSLVTIGVAYYIILKNGFTNGMIPVQIAIGLGVIGTLLFFLSLSGFLISLLRKNERFYLNKLNMFVLRQINSKVNTTYISMAIISLMLFLTTTLLATGVSFKNSLKSDLENSTRFDVTFYSFTAGEDEGINPEKTLTNLGFDYKNKFKDYLSFNLYKGEDGIKQYLYNYVDNKVKKSLDSYDSSIDCISISDFNKLREMEGEERINLRNNELLLISNMNGYYQAVDKFIKDNKTMMVGDKNYNIYNKDVIHDNLETSSLKNKFLVVVLPDEDVKGLSVGTYYLNANFKDNASNLENEIYDIFKGFTNGKYSYDDYGFILGQTKQQAYDESVGMSTTALYIGIYLGIIFLISSAAILALQQLSEASDNVERYGVLKKIGVSSKMMNGAVFSQIFIYFMMPLGLSIIHSIVGITVASKTISMFGNNNILVPSMITAGVIAVVYGGYFIATYFGYKNIIKNR